MTGPGHEPVGGVDGHRPGPTLARRLNDMPADGVQTPGTVDRLAGIKERVRSATSGPWRVVDLRHQKGGQIRVFGANAAGIVANVLRSGPRPGADADFIADARDDVEWLVAEVERLTEKLQQAERQVEQLRVGTPGEGGTVVAVSRTPDTPDSPVPLAAAVNKAATEAYVASANVSPGWPRGLSPALAAALRVLAVDQLAHITDAMVDEAACVLAGLRAPVRNPARWWNEVLDEADREQWRADVRKVLNAFAAGLVVLELPAPDMRRERLDGVMHIWNVGGWSVTAIDDTVAIKSGPDGYGDGMAFRPPGRVPGVVTALLAAADLLAGGSQVDDPPRGPTTKETRG